VIHPPLVFPDSTHSDPSKKVKGAFHRARGESDARSPLRPTFEGVGAVCRNGGALRAKIISVRRDAETRKKKEKRREKERKKKTKVLFFTNIVQLLRARERAKFDLFNFYSSSTQFRQTTFTTVINIEILNFVTKTKVSVNLQLIQTW